MQLDYLDFIDSYSFNIQRFSSAENEGRTEKASEHKKKKAREEGRVALSKDVPAAIVTLVTFATISGVASYIMEVFTFSFNYVFQNLTTIDVGDPKFYWDALFVPCVKIFLPLAAVATITAIVTNYFQIGFKFAPKAIKPDFHKISPNIFKFIKKQILSVTGAFNLIKSLVKIIIIGLVAYMTIAGKFEEILGLMDAESLFGSMVFLSKISIDIIYKSVILLLIFAVIDYMFVRWQYNEQLKMKKEEVKQEYKEMEGDPQVKSKLKQMYRDLLSENKMLGEVPKSDVVITNPTHYAVALKYDKNTDFAPKVIAKGEDRFAQEIKKTARDNNVFIYENVYLARKLYAEVEVNDIIPNEFYSLVVTAYKLAYEFKAFDRQAEGAGV